MSSMLEQAVIDAAALKEVALQNAEAAIVEKYSTEVKEAMKSLLEQEDDMGLDELDPELDMGDETEDDSVVDSVPLAATDGEDVCPCPDEEEVIVLDFDDLARQMDAEGAAPDEMTDAEEFADEVIDDEEFDLDDEGLRESLLEIAGIEEGDFPDLTGDGKVTQADVLKGRGVELNEDDDDDDGDDLDEDVDITEEQLEEARTARINVFTEPEGKDGWKNRKMLATFFAAKEGSEKAAVDKARALAAEYQKENPGANVKLGRKIVPYSEEVDNLDEDIDITEEQLEEIINSLQEKLTVDVDDALTGWAGRPHSDQRLASEKILAKMQDTEVKEEAELSEEAIEQVEKLSEAKAKLEDQVGALTEQNTKLTTAVVALKEHVEGVNVTNAKLLYTNRVLTNDSLNERQKNKIVEAISNADSVEEAKVIFDTLQSAVGSTDKREPKSLSEAVDRSSTHIMSSRNATRHESKVEPAVTRWQLLAGLKQK
jgi:hypothetical protein